jgi:hypothetical protein
VAFDSIGDAYIDVHANTGPFHRELPHELEGIAHAAEGDFEKAGREFGDKMSDGISNRLRTRGKTFGKDVERATARTVIRIKSIFRFDRLRDSIRRHFRRDIGDSLAEETANAFEAATPIFNKIGQGIADAVGAGFNVSGKSPLILILIPAIGALIGLFTALAQAINAAVAVLLIVPGLLASIGLQVGVLFLAFHGLGGAIQQAFAAKNAKEFQLAIKGLSHSAARFVRELLPLRTLFSELQKTAQEKFFKQLLGVIPTIQKALGPLLVQGVGAVAGQLGKFFRDLGKLLASPAFINFFKALVPATTHWLDMLSKTLFGKRGFVTSILEMATALMPFMVRFGDIILRNLDEVSGFFFQLAHDPATLAWLDRMAATLQLVFDLAFKVGEFLFILLNQLDAAGGQELFNALIEAIDRINFVLASPVGKKALEGLIDLGIISIKVISGLFIALLGFLALEETLAEFLKNKLGPAFVGFVKVVGQAIVNFADWVALWLSRIVGGIAHFFSAAAGIAHSASQATIKWVTDIILKIIEWLNRIKGIPGQVQGVFKNFGSLLINSGRALIGGLIQGVKDRIGELLNLLSGIAGRIANFFGLSPAKEGPLSGRGWMRYRGQHLIEDLVEGMKMETPELRRTTVDAVNNIIFSRDSIQMTFQGAPPTQAQARSTGAAMGNSAADLIAARNTRLVVRTL